MLDRLVFYRCGDSYNTYEKHVPAPYIRRSFSVPAVVKTELNISGLGFYRVFVNGKDITKGLLAPYISNPDDMVYFDSYDITPYLTAGENVLGIILGNGMQNCHGGRVWDFDITAFRNVPCFAFAIVSGGKTVAESDGSCRWTESPIIFDDLRSGCFYDANKEIGGWNLPGYDDSSWKTVSKADNPRGERRFCEADPIVVTKEIAPVLIEERVLCDSFDNRENMRLDTEYKFGFRGKKGIMFDFGINTAGIFRLKIDGRKGQKIFIQFCEHITKAGEPFYRSTGSFYPDGYGQTAYYICKGEKNEVFVPDFTYIGYRCAVVFGLEPDQVSPETLTMLVANSDIGQRAGFSCSDRIMNSLRDMAEVSDYANFYYFPTDCPHREKNGWTGDAAVSAEHIILTKTPEKSYREWLRNICKAQRDDGALPGIIPTGGWGFEWGNGPAWDNVLTELCYRMYVMRGDLAPASECADSMMRYLNYISGQRREDGLIEIGLGDWLQPGKGAGDPTAPVYITDSVITMYISEKSSALFGALGLGIQKAFADTLAGELRASLRKLINPLDMTVYPCCQTVQAMFIYYNVFDPAEKKAAAEQLVGFVHASGDHIDCGILGLRVIFHVLSEAGFGSLAYRMIVREDYPSYGMNVRRGLTSLPEDFICDESFDQDRIDSLNHHFMGDITSWFIQKVAGISVNPRKVSPTDFDIYPDFIDGLEYADAYYDSPAGRISVSWKKDGDTVLLKVGCPGEITGSIKLHPGCVFVSGDRRSRYFGANVRPLAAGEYLIKTA